MVVEVSDEQEGCLRAPVVDELLFCWTEVSGHAPAAAPANKTQCFVLMLANGDDTWMLTNCSKWLHLAQEG